MRRFIFAALISISACSTWERKIEHAEPVPDGSLRGIVRNVDGWELSGLQVLAISEDGRGAKTGFTDANGVYVINEVGFGAYTLQVSRRQSVVAERLVRVHSGSAINTHFVIPSRFGDRPEQRNASVIEDYLRAAETR